MGSDRHYPEEAPAHRVKVDGFWIDVTPVTNAEFGRFVEATGYVTVAEHPADPKDYPGAKPEMLAPSSVVFTAPNKRVDMRNPYNWWIYVPGADWRYPRGPLRSTVSKIIQWFTSRTRMRRPSRHGPERNCRQKRNGNLPRGETRRRGLRLG